MTKRKKISIGVLAALLFLGVGCYLAFGRGSVQYRKVQAMIDNIPRPADGGMPPRQDRPKFDDLLKEVDKLSDLEKLRLFLSHRQEFERRSVTETQRYFALSTEDKKKFMAERVQEDEQRRKEREANQSKDKSGNPNPSRGGFGGPGGPGGGQPQTAAQRRQRQIDMMSHVSPVQRAQWMSMRNDMVQARAAAGLPPMPQGRSPR
jgi:hypothetical protein